MFLRFWTTTSFMIALLATDCTMMSAVRIQVGASNGNENPTRIFG